MSKEKKVQPKKEVDPALEEKVKSLLAAKLQNSDFQKNLTSEEVGTIEKMFDLFPDLKNLMHDGQDTINKNEIVLDEIKIKDKTYYLDTRGGLWNTNAELVGVSKKLGEYHFFEDINDINDKTKIKKDLNFFMNQ